jgi:acetyl esterase/lipase
MVCDPQNDDMINRQFATQHGFLVVSINYRLAPRNPFPDSVHDVAEVIRAVLADDTLPYDPSKVAIIGFSAGGNLTLSVAQLPGIKEKVQSLVPFYPVVDFTGKYKGPYKTTKDGKPDPLKNIAPLFNWAYIPPGQDKADPLLSPVYAANKDQLPQRVFFVAAEYDYLEHEANLMAKMLAGVDAGEELGFEWEKNGVKWRTVPDVIHAWTHIELKGEEEAQRVKGLEVLYQDVADWLRR